MITLQEIQERFGDRVWPDSVNEAEGGFALMIDAGAEDHLVTAGLDGFDGEDLGGALECRLTHENAQALRRHFSFTAPSRILGNTKTMGVGDRLGICTPGHIRAFRAHPEFTPVFAQQSIRELNLTGRTFEHVLDCVTFAVFREGFRSGFGADGDHLKTFDEVDYALRCGYTMITLDCSEHIRGDITDENCGELYVPEPELEALYLNQTFDAGEGVSIHFDAAEFKKAVLIYGKAIDFAADVYRQKIAGAERDRADFEISIDETGTPTTPAQHYFVASELIRRGVRVVTVAPRFCGEFQKGVDYRGDLQQFDAELKAHAAIARHFGYKLSIHSGSDKFSVFPSIGRETRGNYHVKTAGTNWLQAMLLIARCEPALYREVHRFALGAFSEARKYYHVTTDLSRIPEVDSLTDAELPSLFGMDDARQLIHITYGLILNAKDAQGASLFRDRLFAAWRAHEDALSENVSAHIERHMIKLLGGERA